MTKEIVQGIVVGLGCILVVVGTGSMIGFGCSIYEPSEERLATEQGAEGGVVEVEESVEGQDSQ